MNCNSLEDHDLGYKTIGGFPGHPDVHPTGNQVCLKCGKSLKEIVQEEVVAALKFVRVSANDLPAFHPIATDKIPAFLVLVQRGKEKYYRAKHELPDMETEEEPKTE